MAHFLDPDSDLTSDQPQFDLPDHLRASSQCMHAAAIVIGRHGILLRGATNSGKSVLQRALRQEAEARGGYSALISDDFVRIARAPNAVTQGDLSNSPPLLAFAPRATYQLQEIRGLGLISAPQDQCLTHAVIHLLVDCVALDQLERMPRREDVEIECLGYALPRLAVPQKSVVAASDLVFALLSTWKDGH